MACLVAALTIAACALLLAAAVLAPAPIAVLPLVTAVCIGCPLVLGWSLPPSVTVLRGDRALRALRRGLDRLPETKHPLGL